jgi:hypothetical protein
MKQLSWDGSGHHKGIVALQSGDIGALVAFDGYERGAI